MASAVFGLVLAGGDSRRMGRDKALLDRDGKSQLSFAYALLDGVTDRCFVSVREGQSDGERARFPRIVDRYADMGPVAGILSAMEEHPDVDWYVVACDLPNLDEPTLVNLLQYRSEPQPFTAYRSRYDGLPEPLCAIYKAGSDSLIRQFVDDGIVCPRKILIRSDTLLFDQPNPAALDNINTPDDLDRSVLGASG